MRLEDSNIVERRVKLNNKTPSEYSEEITEGSVFPKLNRYHQLKPDLWVMTSGKSESDLMAKKFGILSTNLVILFHVTGLFLCSLKILENQKFPDVFRGY